MIDDVIIYEFSYSFTFKTSDVKIKELIINDLL